jgi:hypothetical protein
MEKVQINALQMFILILPLVLTLELFNFKKNPASISGFWTSYE